MHHCKVAVERERIYSMSKAVIGMGTNMGDRAANLRAACSALGLLPQTQVLRVSSVYKTSPVGYSQQDDFYNAVALIATLIRHKRWLIPLGSGSRQ